MDRWSPDSETPRCTHTGGRLVCNGHFDYYGTFMTWTRHTLMGVVRYRVIPYDHPAPEVIETRSVPR